MKGRHILAVVAGALAAVSATAPATAATWRGTASAVNREPNVLAGDSVRVAYVLPADGRDRVAEVARQIESDAETIDTWWRRQDATRTVRFEVSSLPCGTQLDIWSVRLAQTGAELAMTNAPAVIARTLALLDHGPSNAKYIAYYDGPVADRDVCGSAAGAAIVFLGACAPDVESSVVAAHELLHVLGAVPNRAPHACALPNDSHICDDKRDIMYPYADGSALATLVLDSGRDDYYDHPGSWADVRDSPWLVHLDRGLVPLTLASARWNRGDAYRWTVDVEQAPLSLRQTRSATSSAVPEPGAVRRRKSPPIEALRARMFRRP